MRRCVAGLGGFIYGIGLTWICVVALSHFDWFRDPQKVATGCHELGKCATPWWDALFLCGYLFGPATLFTVLNIRAWRRWSLNCWAYSAAALTLAVVALYFLDVLVQRL